MITLARLISGSGHFMKALRALDKETSLHKGTLQLRAQHTRDGEGARGGDCLGSSRHTCGSAYLWRCVPFPIGTSGPDLTYLTYWS